MIDVASWLEGASVVTGLCILGAIIFAESGLLIGFFLPGDTLLFTAGFFAATGHLPLAGVILVIFAAAVIGDNVGYTLGRRLGPRLFRKKDGILFRQEYVAQAEAFYEKHGGKTVIMARFVPVVRTFAPVVAGVGKMPHGRFLLYNIVGAAIWSTGVVLLGFWLGNLVDPSTVEHFLLLAIGLAMAISFGPTIYHLIKNDRVRAYISRRTRHLFGLRTPRKEPTNTKEK